MNTTEHALLIPRPASTLVGVLSLPSAPASMAVLVVVGGPQYRVGSHRQFVLLARKLAEAGYAVLRFDYQGMGDSSGPAVDFLSATQDIAAAIQALQDRVPQAQNIVIWGLCDAASAALLYIQETQDLRIKGLCLLNPWVRSETSLARTQVKHYYLQRVMQPAFWSKLLSGKIAWGALSGLAQNIRTAFSAARPAQATNAPFQQRMAQAWKGFSGSILLLLSGNDFTAKEFLEYAAADASWSGAFERPNVARHDLPDADHTFSNAVAQNQVEKMTLDWLATYTGAHTPPQADKGMPS
jgi:exosortase A-associated hydrolase 1